MEAHYPLQSLWLLCPLEDKRKHRVAGPAVLGMIISRTRMGHRGTACKIVSRRKLECMLLSEAADSSLTCLDWQDFCEIIYTWKQLIPRSWISSQIRDMYTISFLQDTHNESAYPAGLGCRPQHESLSGGTKWYAIQSINYSTASRRTWITNSWIHFIKIGNSRCRVYMDLIATGALESHQVRCQSLAIRLFQSRNGTACSRDRVFKRYRVWDLECYPGYGPCHSLWHGMNRWTHIRWCMLSGWGAKLVPRSWTAMRIHSWTRISARASFIWTWSRT